MNVQIVGAGSVGLLVASYLHEMGLAVTLVCRNEEQRMQLQQNGLTRINLDGSAKHCHINVSAQLLMNVDVTIVTTKSYHLNDMYKQLRQLPAKSAVLFMQNGLEHYEHALQLPQQHIAFASVQFGALKEQATIVRHTGVGIVKIAFAKGEEASIKLTNGLESFPISYEQDAYAMLFEKALLNCFVNPLTAILQVKNGILVRNDHAFQLLQQLYSELLDAFSKEMEHFSFQMVVSLCEKTAMNNSSMLMDRMHHRLSEIDAIVWPMIEKAEKFGKQLPVLKTLYHIVKAIEMEREQLL